MSKTHSTLQAEVRPNRNSYPKWSPCHGGADLEADALRQAILDAKDEVTIPGTTYYISPNGDDANDGTSPETAWKTADAVMAHNELLKAGDGVLFERGYVYRRSNVIRAKSGVTYAAYGEGEKPALYGSVANYALHRWTTTEQKNIWQLDLQTEEAGIIVFNHGVAAGMPKYQSIDELVKNGDFYHDLEHHILYMYLDKGNPAVVYDDIEIGTRATILEVPRDTVDVTIDNLAFKYGGLFAVIAQERTRNVRITNCEMGWVGGCQFGNTNIGLGNTVSFWQDTADALVENCWLYQAYDSGITPQGCAGHTYTNLVFRNNLIEYCNYSIEVFDRKAHSRWDGLVVEDNIMRFAGYGWLPVAARPDGGSTTSHYRTGGWNYNELPGEGITIRRNIFDCSAKNLVYWTGKDYESGLTISDNRFYQKTNATDQAIAFATLEQLYVTNQEELETAVKGFDSNPKVVKWLE